MTRKRLLKHTLLAASIVGVMLPPSISSMRIGSPQEVRAEDRLIGRAVLPAASFAPGPTSGTLLGDEPINGQDVPLCPPRCAIDQSVPRTLHGNLRRSRL